MQKQKISSLLIRSDGVITVFAALVLASLLLFFAVLIDYARLVLFHHYTEGVSRAALRSVLSAYDQQLYEQYQLFGRGGSEQTQLFALTVNQHQFRSVEKSHKFTFFNSQLTDVTITSTEQLGQHTVFGRQLLEEMKYKAPIDLTIELWNKWKPIDGRLQETATYATQMNELQQLYEQREKKLDQALQQQMNAGSSITPSVVEAIMESDRQQIIAPLVIIKDEIENYLNKRTALTERNEEEDDSSLAEITEWVDQYEQYIAQIQTTLVEMKTTMHTAHEHALSKATKLVKEAKAINQQIIDLEAQGRDNGQQANVAADDPQLPQLPQDSISIARSEQYFDDYHQEITMQQQQWDQVISDSKMVAQQLTELLQNDIYLQPNKLQQAINSFQQVVATYIDQYDDPASVLKKREMEDEEAEIKKQLQTNKKTANRSLQQLQQLMKSLFNMDDIEQEQQVFAQVKQRYEQNISFNQLQKTGESVDDLTQEHYRDPLYGELDANVALGRSADQVSSVYGSLDTIINQLQARLYYGEYAVQKFPMFTPDKLTKWLDIQQDGFADKEQWGVPFVEQQLEYIIFGFDHPAANIAAAYGEIIAIRMMIRLMEGLMQYHTLGHPLLILSTALIYALEKTTEDMINLVHKGHIMMSKYTPIPLTYKDHMRLMLLVHTTSDHVLLARMIAVIEQLTDYKLSEVSTGIVSEATYSMPLWFLPKISQIVSYYSNWAGKVSGSTYETTKTIGWSY